jgi:predicted nuclease with TOPRIM domain
MKDSRASGVAKQIQSAISHARIVTSEIRDLLETDRRSVQELTDRAVALRSELETSGKRASQLESELASALSLLANLEEERIRQMGKVQEAASKLRSIVAEDTALIAQVKYDELLSTIENVSANPRDIDCVSALAKKAEPIARLVRAQRAAMSALEQVANSLSGMTETH